ncbi:MAG: J domain-containing protein [Nitrospirales bacterium]
MIVDDTAVSIEIQHGGTRRLSMQGRSIGLSVNLSRDKLQELLDELSLAISPTPYEILGIAPTASSTDIQTAYRTLAKRFHPDGQVGDEAQLKAINAAYEILSNPDQRKQYDQRR